MKPSLFSTAIYVLTLADHGAARPANSVVAQIATPTDSLPQPTKTYDPNGPEFRLKNKIKNGIGIVFAKEAIL